MFGYLSGKFSSPPKIIGRAWRKRKRRILRNALFWREFNTSLMHAFGTAFVFNSQYAWHSGMTGSTPRVELRFAISLSCLILQSLSLSVPEVLLIHFGVCFPLDCDDFVTLRSGVVKSWSDMSKVVRATSTRRIYKPPSEYNFSTLLPTIWTKNFGNWSRFDWIMIILRELMLWLIIFLYMPVHWRLHLNYH